MRDRGSPRTSTHRGLARWEMGVLGPRQAWITTLPPGSQMETQTQEALH